MPAGTDRTGDNALALDIPANRRTKLLDHTHRLVADRQPTLDGVFPLQNVDIGATDGCGRDADQRIKGADIRDTLVLEHDPVGFNENRCLHHLGHVRFLRFEFVRRSHIQAF